jgi:hypothetical protein
MLRHPIFREMVRLRSALIAWEDNGLTISVKLPIPAMELCGFFRVRHVPYF